MKKFDLMVWDINENGGKGNAHREEGIPATSLNELQQMYRMCDQYCEVIREYDGTDDDIPNEVPSNVQMMTTNLPSEVMASVQNRLQNTSKPSTNFNVENRRDKENKVQYVSNTQVTPVKYFNVGGLKCKMENGKIYQKQWVRLSDEEMSEIRVVLNRNNRIYPLNEKHIEVMKWILTEDDEKTDTTTNGKELLNG